MQTPGRPVSPSATGAVDGRLSFPMEGVARPAPFQTAAGDELESRGLASASREDQKCAIGVRSCHSAVYRDTPRGHPRVRTSGHHHAVIASPKGCSKQKPPHSGGFCDIKAEGERFELSDDVAAVNGFRDRPVSPSPRGRPPQLPPPRGFPVRSHRANRARQDLVGTHVHAPLTRALTRKAGAARTAPGVTLAGDVPFWAATRICCPKADKKACNVRNSTRHLNAGR
jgi:hypothetical protein